MVTILGTQTLDSLLILATDVNPSTAGGVASPIGSFGSAVDGSGFFTKTGALDTDWSQVITSGNLLTSVLTGFVVGPNTAITSLDTVLSGFEKAQGQIDALATSSHPAVTISGTPNGLSIVPSTQVLSLALSSTSTTGALSSADWNTFNGKQNALGYTPVNKAGDTMTGFLVLNADAVGALGAVTLQQLQAAVVGVYELQQGYDASTNLFPTAVNTSPLVATIKKGFIWNITVAGILGGAAVTPGDTVLALVDSPGQVAANWLIQEFNLGYTPLSNVLNSANIFVGNASNVATGVTPSGVIAVTNAGVFSYVNASLNLTTKVTGILPIANGGTNSATALVGNRMMISTATGIVEHTAMAVTANAQIWFNSTTGLPASNANFLFNTATGNARIGGTGTSSERLSVVGSGTNTGIGVSGAGVGATLQTSSTTLEALQLLNNSGSVTPLTLLALKNITNVATIGSGIYQSFYDQITGPTTEIVGQWGVITTDVTAGTFKSAFVWRTPNETTGALVERMRLTSAGLFGLGNTPTAVADLSASTLANASLRLRSGVAPTAPNLGDMWYDGTDYIVRATTRNDKVARVLTGSATLDFRSTAAYSFSDLTVTVTGAVLSDCVSIGVANGSIPTNTLFFGWVCATNTVTIRFINNNAVASNPASGTFKVTVLKNI